MSQETPKLEKTPQNFVEIEGVRFYGFPEKTLTKNEIQSVTLPIDAKMHLLKHLSALGQESRQKLTG